MSIIHIDASRDVYIFENSFTSVDECEFFNAFNVAKIDDFLVKECQLRTRESNDGDFIAKRNYKKCLSTIKREWANLASSTCIDLKKYSAYMERSIRFGKSEKEKQMEILSKKSKNCTRNNSIARLNDRDCASIYGENNCKEKR